MNSRNAVFVHGLIGPFAEGEAFDALGDDVVCSAPDLDGYGLARGRVSTAGQVESLRQHVESLGVGRVRLVAHSIGAVYALQFADAHPDLVESVTTVEGNFSLNDAFWSQSIAGLDEDAAREEVTALLEDPEGFLVRDGVVPTPVLLERARSALAYQPWSAVWESARAIVETTGKPEYPRMVQRVFEAMPVFLIAGERSVGGWDVPDWAQENAAGSAVMPGTGHMMMLEAPQEFGALLRRVWEEARHGATALV